MAVSGEMIKQTQNSLGQFVKKPPLTEKLLNKPPFRFLHDVISAVITDTGSLEGLYDDKEMKSDNVKDKEAKVEYLTKLIDCLSFTTGENLSVKPGKIVSGQEADKTNEMLQILANVVINKVDTKEAVSRVRSGEKPGKASKSKGEEGKKSREKSPVKTPSKKDSTPKKGGKENKENNKAENERNKNQSSRAKKEPMRSPEKNSNSKKEIFDENENNNDLHTNGFVTSSETEILRNDKKDVTGDEDENGFIANGSDHPGEADRPKTTRPVTSKERRKKAKSPEVSGVLSKQNSQESDEPSVFGSHQTERTEDRPTTSLARAASARPKTGRLKSARPPSARPAAPAIKKRREIQLEEQPRPATAKVSNLILDNDDEDDGEEFLIEEAPKDPLASLDNELNADSEAIETGGEEHGTLVQQILETQKELQDGNKMATSPKRGVEIVRFCYFVLMCRITIVRRERKE